MGKSQAVSLKEMRKMNKATLLRTIWQRGDISRSELAEVTGLSPATVSALSEELVKERIVVEHGEGPSSGGRKPIMLRVNPAGGYICAVSVESRSITYTLFDMRLEKLQEFVTDNSPEIIVQSLFENMLEHLESLLGEGSEIRERLIGIGISTPKEYDLIGKKVMLDTGLSADRMDLDKALSFHYRTPVYMEYEINAQAIAEYHLGAARYKEEFVFIDVSEEIQATIVQHGKVVKNSVFQKNNIGHMIIDRNGPRCSCGKKGCLQVFASLEAMVKKARVGLAEDQDTLLQGMVQGDMQKVDMGMIARCLEKGDRFLRSLVLDMLEALCIGLLNFFALVGIPTVVVGGKIRRVRELPELLTEAMARAGMDDGGGMQVAVATVSPDRVNVGNGAIVIGNYFDGG